MEEWEERKSEAMPSKNNEDLRKKNRFGGKGEKIK